MHHEEHQDERPYALAHYQSYQVALRSIHWQKAVFLDAIESVTQRSSHEGTNDLSQNQHTKHLQRDSIVATNEAHETDARIEVGSA